MAAAAAAAKTLKLQQTDHQKTEIGQVYGILIGIFHGEECKIK